MRYKKLHNKSIPKKNLYKKSKSKVVGSKIIKAILPDSFDDQVLIELLTPVKTEIKPKKSRLYDFIYKTERKKLINYSLLLLFFTSIISFLKP